MSRNSCLHWGLIGCVGRERRGVVVLSLILSRLTLIIKVALAKTIFLVSVLAAAARCQTDRTSPSACRRFLRVHFPTKRESREPPDWVTTEYITSV